MWRFQSWRACMRTRTVPYVHWCLLMCRPLWMNSTHIHAIFNRSLIRPTIGTPSHPVSMPEQRCWTINSTWIFEMAQLALFPNLLFDAQQMNYILLFLLRSQPCVSLSFFSTTLSLPFSTSSLPHPSRVRRAVAGLRYATLRPPPCSLHESACAIKCAVDWRRDACASVVHPIGAVSVSLPGCHCIFWVTRFLFCFEECTV